MPKVYSYIRFSTPEQARGDSLRRQVTAAEAWCAERGLVLDDTLHDLGVSAYHGANRSMGALRKFLELVERGKIERGSYLVVESLDRLSREAVIDAASRLLDLIRAGITVVTLSDGQEYSEERLRSDWTPLIISLAVMSRAHEESRTKSIRLSKAWSHKKELARSEGKPLTPRCPGWLELREGKFVEVPDRVAIVRRVFRETKEGLGRREIVRRLNAEGVAPFRGGNGWHTSSIAKIIQSRAVLGEYQPHTATHQGGNREPDGDPILDFYPRIIDDATFLLTQEAVRGRQQRAAGRKGVTVHLLQNLARCAECGGPMHIHNKGKPPKGGIYLVCSSYDRKAGCGNARRWRVERLEPVMLTALGFVDAQAFAPLDDATPAVVEQVAVARAKLEAANTRRKRWSEVLDDPDSEDDEEAKARYSAAAAEVRGFKKELKAAEVEAARLAADPGLVARLTDVATLSRLIENPDKEQRRMLRIRLSELLRGLVERVECRADVGAVMVLKPHLGPRRLEGEAPFAFRRTADGIWSALLETKADEDTLETFLGWSDTNWNPATA